MGPVTTDSGNTGESHDELLNQLADEFADRQRAGERPNLEDYCRRHPDLAEDIRSLFPVLADLEQAKVEANPDSTVAESMAPPVTILGDFRLLREVGRGGMGVVYEAEQISLDRRVALKLLPASVFRDPVKKRRFEREAKAAAKLHHTNIVPVHGFGEHDGTLYYVMQFIPGLGLDGVIDELVQHPGHSRIVSRDRPWTQDHAAMSVVLARSLIGEETAATADRSRPRQDALAMTEADRSTPGPLARTEGNSANSMSPSGINLPGQSGSGMRGSVGSASNYWPSVARIGVQVAGALYYAHKQGILHRDIKPANLLLDLDGIVWVADFGLAKADDSDDLTHTGDLLGTFRYMPPEAFEGKFDVRGDIYGLGLTLFELIALRPAYEERDRNKLIKEVTTGDPPRLGKLRKEAPRDLVTIVEKAIEKDPARRYQTAGEFADDLQRFLDGRPITARRARELERAWMWAQRRPAVAGLVVSLFFCLLAGSVFSTMFAFRADRFARNSELRENEAMAARDAALEARRALSRTLADSYVTLGQIAGDRRDAALAALWFANAAAQSEGDDHRDAINRIRVNNWAAEGILVPVAAIDTPSLVQRLDFHPSGQYLAGLTQSGEYSVWDLGASAVWRGPPGIEKPTAVAWDRDGARVVLGGQNRAGMFAFPSGEMIRTWDWAGPVAAAAFSPDGTKLALGGTTLQVWDVKADRPASPRWVLPSPLHAIAFTPDDSRVVTVGTDQVMRIYAVGSDRLEPEYTTPNQPHGPPQFLDGGAVVVTFPTETTAAGLDLATGAVKFRLDLRGDNGWEFKLATSPDGKSILAPNGLGNGVNRWNSAGQSVAGDFPHLNMIFSLAVSPNGSMLASGAWDRTLRIWDLKTRTLRFPEMTSVSSPVTVAWSPDGRQVAAAYEGRYLRVWALPPGLPVRTIVPGGAISMARFAPDGRSVLPHSGSNNLASQRQVQLYDAATGKPNSAPVDLGGALLAADITADGRRLVTAITHLSDRTDESPQASVVFTPEAGEGRFWDVVSGRSVSGPIKVPAEPRDVRFRPEGREAAVVCAGREVLILDSATGRVKKTFPLKPFQLPATFHVGNHQLGYSRDGQRLYVYAPNGGGLQVLHAETGETLFAAGKEVFDVRESPDGSIVAVAFGRNDLLVRQFDTRTFQEVAPPIRHPDWVFSVRFDRTGDRLLTSCRDRAARLWDRKTGQMLAAFSHENEVVAAELFGEDRFVVSVGHDKVARISDAATGRPVAPPIDLGGLGLSIDVSPDGRWVVMGGFTTRLTVLDLVALTRPALGTPQQLVRRSELLAGRRIDAHGSVVNLTADEWKERWAEYRRTLPAGQ